MTDDFIIKLFIKDNGKLQLNYMKKKWIESHEDIKYYLENRYDDFTGDINYGYNFYLKIQKIMFCYIDNRWYTTYLYPINYISIWDYIFM